MKGLADALVGIGIGSWGSAYHWHFSFDQGGRYSDRAYHVSLALGYWRHWPCKEGVWRTYLSS